MVQKRSGLDSRKSTSMKRSALLRSSFCVAASVFSIFAAAASAQLVNGGFENGDFSGWMVTDPSGFSNIGSDPALANSGTYHANLGAFGLLGSLSQTFSTAAGSSYNLSFALANDGTFPPNEFDVFWNGALVFSLSNYPALPYVNFSVANLNTTGTSTTLEFRYRNDADFFRLDDVSASVVPEASTTSLALLGLGLTSLVHYRRTKGRPSANAV